MAAGEGRGERRTINRDDETWRRLAQILLSVFYVIGGFLGASEEVTQTSQTRSSTDIYRVVDILPTTHRRAHIPGSLGGREHSAVVAV